MIFKSLLEVIDPIDSVSLCLVQKDNNEILDIFQSKFKWEIDRKIIDKYWRHIVLYILVENDHCIQIMVEEPKKDGRKKN